MTPANIGSRSHRGRLQYTMQWRNVRLIYLREIRDQLRDRRTLFMIAVLPLLLYPLLGMSVFQLRQFLRESEPKVLVIGSEALAGNGDLPALFRDGRFAVELFDTPTAAARLKVEFVGGADADTSPSESGPAIKKTLEAAEKRLKAGDVQLVLHFPADFGQRLQALRAQITVREDVAVTGVPSPQLFFNSGKEISRMAHMQVDAALNAWKAQIISDNLVASRVPANVSKPFELKPRDVAERHQQQALVWSKVMPFVLFIWALTGAFYPAVDLCAGEKERGTLETLLSSPALRTEIVWGKLLTVMTFSSATALLNLASIGFTARQVIGQLSDLPGPNLATGLQLPPLTSILWLVIALVPMSALFSALCLACAAFARSTKEGQYYLMPLLLVIMPLMMLPMAPGAELDLGNSLIPVTGVVLLLRSLVQGDYAEALRYLLPVCLVTFTCCLLAIRWAVYQFNQESVLFRESERLDLRRWIVHLVRDRRETPSLAEAIFGVVLIYMIQFFTNLAIAANPPSSPDFSYLALVVFISQVVCFAMPALLMTLFLTGKPLKTLLLDRAPNASAVTMALLLAVVLHPVGLQLVHWIRAVYPIRAEALDSMHVITRMIQTAPWPWLPYVLLAVLPAICEELTFRGYVLSGLRHLGSKWWAIGLSAMFFGIAHMVLQQSIAAAALGLVLGYLAVQTGNLVPCIAFHLTYNTLTLATPKLHELAERQPMLSSLFRQPAPDEIVYNWPIVVVCSVAALAVLAWFQRLPYQATKEEQISDARARQSHPPLAASAPGGAD
jgi:sodium transport system permease protein